MALYPLWFSVAAIFYLGFRFIYLYYCSADRHSYSLLLKVCQCPRPQNKGGGRWSDGESIGWRWTGSPGRLTPTSGGKTSNTRPAHWRAGSGETAPAPPSG
ncbi:uncharacterized protein LOC124162083 isoform X7 [Ischnura elegans]|uniref:uncharacterized protein LOC124162083 isoform X7 n=1 Tax=Ischnura elegans TaxID=197161 RepID=UPI001ED86C24|nr:uncharacterized protein LOC124162083 isoform X7 [Ischnura elegans]